MSDRLAKSPGTAAAPPHPPADSGGTGDPEPNRVVPLRHPGRWVAVVVILVLVAMLIHGLITNPNYRWGTFWLYLRDTQVLTGLSYTLVLTVGSMIIAIIVAVIMAVMRLSENPVFSTVSWAYLWFFRGTPVYTQLVFWGLLSVLYPRLSLGIPFGPEFLSFSTSALITPFVAALFGLAINESAYLAEIVRTGIQSVDRGQTEAAQALGMTQTRIMWRIVLPQAMRVIVPPTGNETISMLKTTSLVLAVPFTQDLTYATTNIANRVYLPVPLLLVAAFWYLVVTSVLMVGQYYLERYYGRGVAGASSAKGGMLFLRRAATPRNVRQDDNRTQGKERS